ncbi:unnamed protein product [Acanthoscelides obtectus]|uniref:Uncharacterized protein n=1 Tax=Acanthoscelides obtectus TaxID=200917 RepID=A0A9P0JUX3_ACAOB|nr:unnamed protein product [Acanthoscelides obtectus]CAK1627985.1 hypothetical protein AOBTE_LOCUS4942 [Acanthoscelides obtectus]
MPHGLWRGNTCACNMHTFWLCLRDSPGGTSTFDSQRPSTTYGQSQHPEPREKFLLGRNSNPHSTEESTTAATAAA